MTKLTYSDSPFFSNWSQTYFTNLTLDQHIANNNWFMTTLTMLKDDGILYVQRIDKPETREPYTGNMIKEYGGREDGLVKEQYNYQDGKLDGVQVLWYSDGLQVEKTYNDGEIISTNKIKGEPIKVIEPF